MVNSTDFQKALELINKSTNCLLSGHIRPDGDSCGSMMAMTYALKKLGKKTNPILLSPLAKWYEFLFDSKVPLLGNDITVKELESGRFDDCDLVIIVDTNSYIQLPGLADWLKKTNKPILVMDHHKTSDGIGNVELIDTEAAATGEIIFDLFNHAGWEIDKKIAEALFVAIATDTGWFRCQNTSARACSIAGELIAAGTQPDRLYRQLYQQFPAARFHLRTLAMQTLELHCDGQLAVMQITKAMLSEIGADRSLIENTVNEPMEIASVEAVALLVEQDDGQTRCSLRSREVVDVNAIAQTLGGGGHARAAGLTLEMKIPQARPQIIDAISQALQPKA